MIASNPGKLAIILYLSLIPCIFDSPLLFSLAHCTATTIADERGEA